MVAMLVGGPVGLGSAIYLAEYASPRVRSIVKPTLEVLAGIPSVVLGFFALTWISPTVVQSIFTGAEGFNLLAAGIGVGILTVPLVASVSEDAMRAVPLALREASYGLGAKRVTTSLRVVIPAAISGIVAAFILAISRAVGETMVVAIAAGASGGSLFSLDPTGPGQTLTAAMASLATGSDQVTGDSSAFQSLFFVGFVLFVLTLGLNVIGDAFVRRTRQRY
jgi:phosphate transport system permease protein